MSRTATCFFTGRLAKDPELVVRKRPDGTEFSILKLNIITNSPRKVNGEWKEKSHGFFVDLFGPLANTLYQNRTLLKGDLVNLDCDIENSSYEKNGMTIYTNEFKLVDFTRLVRAPSNRTATANANPMTYADDYSSTPVSAGIPQNTVIPNAGPIDQDFPF